MLWANWHAAVLWFLWAYTPKWVMQALSITYYPGYWAARMPHMAGVCPGAHVWLVSTGLHCRDLQRLEPVQEQPL